MRRVAALCLLLAGCSSAPVADLMDCLAPGRLAPAPGYHGGVGAQQQPAVQIAPEGPPPIAPSVEGCLPPVPLMEGLGIR